MEQFAAHNLFRKDVSLFLKNDPQLSMLDDLPFVFESPLEERIPLSTPGIYILTGGRQVGKSTLVKQIIRNLLGKEIAPELIFYLPCDTIETFDGLMFHIESFKEELAGRRPFFLFIDEITYVKNWDRAIKALADEGLFRNGSVLITGSDSVILKEAMMRFPGRRGEADEQDFHYYPLSFYDFVSLKDKPLAQKFLPARTSFHSSLNIDKRKIDESALPALEDHFNTYLLTGGFLKTINNLASKQTIPSATYKTYIQWIVGDILKRGKQEKYLREITQALIKRLAKQITWNNLTADLSIDHHKTTADYVHLLERMDVVRVLSALREDKLRAAPKKAKKVHISDPFVFHALNAWIAGKSDAFGLAQQTVEHGGEVLSDLVEGVVASLFSRTWESYYIKAASEVDLALISDKSFMPIEIKYSYKLQRSELKQILKYSRGIVAYRGQEIGLLDHLTVAPIPLIAFMA